MSKAFPLQRKLVCDRWRWQTMGRVIGDLDQTYIPVLDYCLVATLGWGK